MLVTTQPTRTRNKLVHAGGRPALALQVRFQSLSSYVCYKEIFMTIAILANNLKIDKNLKIAYYKFQQQKTPPPKCQKHFQEAANLPTDISSAGGCGYCNIKYCKTVTISYRTSNSAIAVSSGLL